MCVNIFFEKIMTTQKLTFSMRSSLLNLRGVAQDMSAMQNVLASGKKVSSALDNPASYYTAISLSHRASELNRLIDSMGESLSTLKTASEVLKTSIEFLELAKSVASKGLYENIEYSPDDTIPDDTIPDKPDPSKISITKEIMSKIMIDKGIGGYVVSTANELKNALATATSGDKIVIIGSINMGEEQLSIGKDISLVGAETIIREQNLNNQYEVPKTAKANLHFLYEQSETPPKTHAINLGANSIVSDISFDFDNKVNASLFNAATSGIKLHNIDIDLNSMESFGISGGLIYITGDVSMSGVNNITMSGKTLSWNMTAANYNGKLYVDKDAIINFDGGGEGSLCRGGNVIMNGTINAKNLYTLFIYSNGVSGATINGTVNVKDHIGDSIFSNSKINLGSNAVLNVAAGSKTTNFNATATVTDFQTGAKFNFYKNGIISSWQATGNGSYNGKITIGGSSDLDVISKNWQKTSRPGTADEILKDFVNAGIEGGQQVGQDYRGASQQFNKIINQYDKLIKDGNYLSNNLLLQQDLKINFNENYSSFINIKGVDASLNGLNLSYVDWNNKEDIMATISKLDNAISLVRNYSREFGNYYTTVNIRKDFTGALIDVLKEGADKLTLADMNQASADILALQTRQQLAINSISLASTVNENILRIFMKQ